MDNYGAKEPNIKIICLKKINFIFFLGISNQYVPFKNYGIAFQLKKNNC